MNNKKRFNLICGPCAVESYEVCIKVANKVQVITERLNIPYTFKASYKKANRTSLNSFTGIGNEKALAIIAKVKAETGLLCTTDIHAVNEAEMAAEVVDTLQIPAFLCRQTDLLIAAGKTGKIVNIKKGQFMGAEAMRFAADKVASTGNNKIGLMERGTTFGYQDLIVDFRNVPVMQQTGYPVILDCTHSLQRPNQTNGVTGGQPKLIETISKAGIAVGVDGLFVETHPNPSEALSDGANMLPLNQLEALLEKLVNIWDAVQ
ncbi:UNVERIFIED_CONTAM: hypothetical protein GTU68_049681 [Idotea baltica]|nr:hypothetical protein [Idotea baltica]